MLPPRATHRMVARLVTPLTRAALRETHIGHAHILDTHIYWRRTYWTHIYWTHTYIAKADAKTSSVDGPYLAEAQGM